MKLLTKLGALGSCWQSPLHTVSGFEQENHVARLNPPPKRRRPAGTSANWRPALTVISEDNCGVEEMKMKTKLAKKERRAKAFRARVKHSSSYDSSWKIQPPIVMPAFSPAPFMF